jgi:hypothetical protein
MTTMPDSAERDEHGTWLSLLNRPISWVWCVTSWVLATAIFVEAIRLLGGVTSGDASDSTNTVWAFAHGMASCAYPPNNQFGLPYSAPLYSLLSGAIAGILRIGHRVPFPNSTAFGPHCSHAVLAMYYWSLKTGATLPTLQLGYVGWVVLLFGVVALLRSAGRGRCGWEPLTVVLLALVPPVLMSLHEYFHPQDMVAMGLILGGVACVRRGSWVWAGILLGLAFTGQQFTLLVLAPLVMIVPRHQLVRFVTSVVGAIVVVVAPIALFAPKGVLDAAFTGSGTTGTSSTWLDLTRLSGSSLFVASRFLPIAAAMILAWWAYDRLGLGLLESVPLLSLVATSLAFRLIFEVNLWGYYFMATAVSILVMDVVRGRLRWSYLSWLVLISVAFHPVLGEISAWSPLGTPWLPLWVWQLVLTFMGVFLAVSPLAACVREITQSDATSSEAGLTKSGRV